MSPGADEERYRGGGREFDAASSLLGITELIRLSLSPIVQALLDWKTAELFSGVPGRKTDVSRRLSLRLYDLAGKCEVRLRLPSSLALSSSLFLPLSSLFIADLSSLLFLFLRSSQGMSGRTLRRLPVLAHARYISINTLPEVGNKATKLASWISAMEKVVRDENEAIKNVQDGGTTML